MKDASSESSTGKDLALIIIYKGLSKQENHGEELKVEELIRKILELRDPEHLAEVAQYHLSLINDPPRFLDSSKTLRQSGVEDHDVLVLTKRLAHIEIRRDVWVAGGMAAYTAAFFSIALWLILSIWPRTTPELTSNMTRTVTIAQTNLSFSLGPENLLLLTMVLSGVIGACVFSLFAISLHLGHYKDFDKAWTAWYLLRPFIGAGLALVVEFLIKGTVLTVGADLKNINLVGLAGIGSLAGTFAEQTIRKLNEIADTIFGRVTKQTSDQNNGTSTP